MSLVFSEDIQAHESIYATNPKDRTVHLEYGVPERGVCESTGLLVVLSGYGGNASANVHRHMREDFPDKYDLVVMHCDYFGISHMQSDAEELVRDFMHNPDVINADFCYRVNLQENENDFNDMGLMQALDVVNATKYLFDKYEGVFDTGRVILFGTSHGGYIAHLVNIICPELFTYLIDVSGYIIPYYLDHVRALDIGIPEKNNIAHQLYMYRAGTDKYCYEEVLYDLDFLYKHIENKCKIIALHGDKDWMVNCDEKKRLIESINNSEFLVFTEQDVDGEVIRSNNHGLELDFLKFLNMYLDIISRADNRRRNSNFFRPSSIEGLLQTTIQNGMVRAVAVKGAKEFGEKAFGQDRMKA